MKKIQDLQDVHGATSGYMVVTAHYIDSSWTLKSQILRYVKIIELLIHYLDYFV